MRSDEQESVDVLRYGSPESTGETATYKMVSAGKGAAVVAAHEAEVTRRRRMAVVVLGGIAVTVTAIGWVLDQLVMGVLAGVIVLGAAFYGRPDPEVFVPELVATGVAPPEANARWDAERPPNLGGTGRESDGS